MNLLLVNHHFEELNTFCEYGSKYCFALKTNDMSILNSSKEHSLNYMSRHGNENATEHTH